MSYIIIVLILGILIFIHELGHFIAAKLAKIPVQIFSLGFGPKLFSRTIKETEYRISAIPLGGYVMPKVEDEKEFFAINVDKRIIFSLGGPIANLISIIILYSFLNMLTGHFSFADIFLKPFYQTVDLLFRFVVSLKSVFTHSAQLSGIVGIMAMGKQIIDSSLIKAINFSIILSVNFAVLNLFPIPALDGGKIILYLLEKINPKLLKLHIPFTIAGWVIIIALFAYTTILDISKFIIKMHI